MESAGAVAKDANRQTKMSIRKNSPSLAQLVATHMRLITAGDIAGAWEDFGSIGPQLTKLADVAWVGFTNNQEAAAKIHETQDTEWRQLAGLGVVCSSELRARWPGGRGIANFAPRRLMGIKEGRHGS